MPFLIWCSLEKRGARGDSIFQEASGHLGLWNVHEWIYNVEPLKEGKDGGWTEDNYT
jgi:hypothetical protein